MPPGEMTQFARSTLGGKRAGESEFLAGAALNCQLAQAFGGVEAQGDSERFCAMTEQTALQSKRQGGEADYVDGQRSLVGAGAATAANRAAGEEDLRSETGDLGLPPGFFVARQLGHVG